MLGYKASRSACGGVWLLKETKKKEKKKNEGNKSMEVILPAATSRP